VCSGALLQVAGRIGVLTLRLSPEACRRDCTVRRRRHPRAVGQTRGSRLRPATASRVEPDRELARAPQVATVARWELTPTPRGTLVRVTHRGLSHEAAARKDYVGGWQGMLNLLRRSITTHAAK